MGGWGGGRHSVSEQVDERAAGTTTVEGAESVDGKLILFQLPICLLAEVELTGQKRKKERNTERKSLGDRRMQFEGSQGIERKTREKTISLHPLCFLPRVSSSGCLMKRVKRNAARGM
mmetsp:Transcript_34/g.123  ORF Transcript_34/g.123 Transcript_34/m.123 type:complete len:118 (-) Transcript_34:523-876(-)